MQTAELPERLQTTGITKNWMPYFTQIPCSDDGTIGPTQLHTFFKNDKIPKDMTRDFLDAIANIENIWVIKEPATSPKKNSTLEIWATATRYNNI